jgi:hypothetical protein
MVRPKQLEQHRNVTGPNVFDDDRRKRRKGSGRRGLLGRRVGVLVVHVFLDGTQNLLTNSAWGSLYRFTIINPFYFLR